jgi:hypothetical protein
VLLIHEHQVRIAVVDMNLGDAVTNKSVVAFTFERKTL